MVILLFGGGAFWGGMKYAQSKISSSRLFQVGQQNIRNFPFGERQQMGLRGSDFLNGEIISKDDKSITIKLRDGGSRIVFVPDSTDIMKFASGTLSDLVVGKNIVVFGVANSDGSLTANSIQLRR